MSAYLWNAPQPTWLLVIFEMSVKFGSRKTCTHKFRWYVTPTLLQPLGYDPWVSFLKLTTVLVIFWNFQISYQMFLSQQVRRNVIITSKNFKYELTDELANKKNLKTPWNYSLVSSLRPKMKILSILVRNY